MSTHCVRFTKRLTDLRRWVLLGSLAGCAVAGADSWPTFRGDATQSGVAATILSQELELLWTARVGGGIEGSAVIDEGVVYVGGLDSTLSAFDLATGSQRWIQRTSAAIVATPAVMGESVFVGDEAGVFHAVDSADGKLRWRIITDAKITSAPNVRDGRVLFGSYDGNLYSVRTDSGSVAWQVQTDDYIHGAPALADSLVITAGCDGLLRLVDFDDGVESGQIELGTYVAASVAVSDGLAYVGTFGNEVLAIDLRARAVSWRYQSPQQRQPFYGSAAVTKRLVLIGGRDRLLHAIERETGEPSWSFDAGAKIDSSPVVAGDRVYFGTSAGTVHALDLTTGESHWSFESGAEITASPAIAAGRLVIGNAGGLLLCFGSRNTSSD